MLPGFLSSSGVVRAGAARCVSGGSARAELQPHPQPQSQCERCVCQGHAVLLLGVFFKLTPVRFLSSSPLLTRVSLPVNKKPAAGGSGASCATVITLH